MKKLIRTRRHDVNTKRGAHFHPTIGSVTPNGLPLATPKLDHYVPRYNPFFRLSDSRDGDYTPPPVGSWK